MKNKKIIIIITTVLGIIFSSIVLYFYFKKSGKFLLENGLVSIFTGCIFALPTYIIDMFFCKDIYNRVNDKMYTIYNLLNEMSSFVDSNNVENIKESAKKINSLINQINDIRNNSILITRKEIDEATYHLTDLNKTILSNDIPNLSTIRNKAKESKAAISIYLKMDEFE